MLSETNMKQVVYIYRCVDTTVQVKGKVNSIIVGQYLGQQRHRWSATESHIPLTVPVYKKYCTVFSVLMFIYKKLIAKCVAHI